MLFCFHQFCRLNVGNYGEKDTVVLATTLERQTSRLRTEIFSSNVRDLARIRTEHHKRGFGKAQRQAHLQHYEPVFIDDKEQGGGPNVRGFRRGVCRLVRISTQGGVWHLAPQPKNERLKRQLGDKKGKIIRNSSHVKAIIIYA